MKSSSDTDVLYIRSFVIPFSDLEELCFQNNKNERDR